MVSLPPVEFTYGKYSAQILSWETIKSTGNYFKYLLSQNVVGYCDSILCEIRPRADDMAVMFEDENGAQSWTHVPKDIMQGFIADYKYS